MMRVRKASRQSRPAGERVVPEILRRRTLARRSFSRWLLTGGKPRLGKISKMGQRDLRRLLIMGAMTVVRHASRGSEKTDPWLARMLERKPKKVVAVALANRMARRVWVLATRKETYRVCAAA